MSEHYVDSENVMGGAGVTADGNVSIGDTSGSVAIGEDIYQFMIKEPSGETLVKLIAYLKKERNKDENLKILSSYSPSALPYFDPTIKEFVTSNRVEELSQSFIYLIGHRILLFTGVGGVGKTTLVRALIDIRPANVPTPFWFDFRMNQSAKLGDILEKLAAYMNCSDLAIFKQEKREPDINDINKLIDKLEVRNSVWLIFDNMETILDDVYFKDEDMDLFFTCLRNSTHEAKIIITSRIFPKLKNGEYLIDIIEGDRQDIKGLKINFAIDYLVKNGIGDLEPGKLEELAIGVDGHPLAMKLLIDLVKKIGVSDTLKDLTRYKNLKEDTIKKTRRLFDKLAEDEKELLERISVYRQTETMNAVEIMFTDKIPIEAVDKLIDKSLLETDHNGKYWLHPLVQEFSYEDLKNKEEVHLIAYNYYKSLDLPENPTKKEDIQSLIEAHYHACEAKEYNLAAQILFEKDLNAYLDVWGDWTTLLTLNRQLLPNNYLKDKVFLSNEMEILVLDAIGLTYRQLGYVRESIEYFKQALKIAMRTNYQLGICISFGNLGIAYRYLYQPSKAIKCCQRALNIARDKINKHEEECNLGYYFEGYYLEGYNLESIGLAYIELRNPIKAIEYYEQALRISKENGYRRLECANLGNLGYAYICRCKFMKAIEYYQQALKISKEIKYKRGVENHLRNIGLAYIKLGEYHKAIEYCEQGLKIAKKIGYRRGEALNFRNLGLLYINMGEYDKANEFLKESLAIGKSIEDPRIINFCEQKLKNLEG